MKILKNLFGDNTKIHGDTIAVKNVSNTFSGINSTDVEAYLIGNLLILNIEIRPTSGWNTVATTTLKPKKTWSLNVHKGTNQDDGKDITAYITSSGVVGTRTAGATTFTGSVVFSGIVMVE
jgi:hypothetical protein